MKTKFEQGVLELSTPKKIEVKLPEKKIILIGEQFVYCLKQNCVKTDAKSGGTDATENEKAAALKKSRRTVMINSILISMDVITLQTVPQEGSV